jgi:replication initiation protein RepC
MRPETSDRLDRSTEHAMEHISSSPVRAHVRRAGTFCPPQPARAAAKSEDPRWRLLDLVRICRSPLGLRDRDITVLRGLLSFVPDTADPTRLVVFASNRALMERCDGIDERTLRRRIIHLQSKGLLARKLSPNGKRYQVRDAQLVYGIDLGPLFSLDLDLEALAEEQRREELRRKALRAMIRHALYHQTNPSKTTACEEARRALRRSVDSHQLSELLAEINDTVDETSVDQPSATSHLTASDSQNDRHIQSSKKESYESEYCDEFIAKGPVTPDLPQNEDRNPVDLSIDECLALAPTAAEMALEKPRCWRDIVALSAALAPAIGLSATVVETARTRLGPLGAALAVLGLVEAFGRIRNPQGYLSRLSDKARQQGFDLVRMFRSLVNRRSPQTA